MTNDKMLRRESADDSEWNPNPSCYELLAPFYADIYGEIDADETVRQWWRLLADAKLVTIPPQALSLVDIGCGPGWQIRAWRELGCTVAGIDSSPTLLASARALLADRDERPVLIFGGYPRFGFPSGFAAIRLGRQPFQFSKFVRPPSA
ncbi:MAG: methyltransferase domain-containing protein [Methylococcales bacterium]